MSARRSFRFPFRDDREIDEELAFHLEMKARDLEAEGLPEAEARHLALARFGDPEKVRLACRAIARRKERDMRRIELISELRQDLAYALRQLAASPGWSLLAVATLALGLGATTAIFSALDAVVLRPLPFPEPERLVSVAEVFKEGTGNVSAGNYRAFREESRSLDGLAAVHYGNFTLTGGELPERVLGARVTHGFFAVFGIRPLHGRTFLPEEDRPGGPKVAVLSHRLWSRRFGADPALVGRQIRLDGEEHTVVGVMPPELDWTLDTEELWVPIALTPERYAQNDEHYLAVFGRLARGASLAEAQAELMAIAERRSATLPEGERSQGAAVTSFLGDLVGDHRARLLVLLGAVGLVLAIACGNVANLLLARGASRGREIAVRAALGASRARLVRQLLTESLVLSLTAGLAGLALAHWIVRAIVALAPAGVPRLESAGLDGGVVAFALALAVASSLAFGIVPALRASSVRPQEAMNLGGRAGIGAARDRLRSVLVLAEVALALVLLVGAGLLVRSAVRLGRVEPGLDASGLLTARLTLPATSYAPEASVAAFTRALEAVEAQPGVSSAAVTSKAPFSPGIMSNGLLPEGRAISMDNLVAGHLRIVSPGFFRTARVPLVAGRLFDARDRAGAPKVMLVNQTLARLLWPGEDALGKRVACCEGTPEQPGYKEIVGVVGDVRTQGVASDAPPEFYLPMEQVPPEAWDWIQRSMTLLVRTPGDPAALAEPVRRAIAAVDPDLPLYDVAPMEERLAGSLGQARFNTVLLSGLGLLGLVLAAVGIYGVVACFVGLRTREIGLRMALGATAGEILGLVVRQALTPVALGLALGLGVAVAATRLLGSQLYGVTATDPITYAGVALVLGLAALAASLLPARRAARLEPTRALE